MVSGTRALPKLVEIEVERGGRAAAPKGPMTYAFTHEEISPPSPSSGWDFGLGAGIWASELVFVPQGWILCLRLVVWLRG